MLMLFTVLVVLLSAVIPTQAAEDKPISPQAQRMKDCNAHAHDRALAGDARKQFMSDCLRGGSSGRSDRPDDGAASPSQTDAKGESTPGQR